jgi:hypothetical protein
MEGTGEIPEDSPVLQNPLLLYQVGMDRTLGRSRFKESFGSQPDGFEKEIVPFS